MSEPARHLFAVDSKTGEVVAPDLCPGCQERDDQIEGLKASHAAAKGQITRLKREASEMHLIDPGHDEVVQVLEYHRDLLMPGAKVSEQSARWQLVRHFLRRDRDTDKATFTVLELQASIVGMSLDDYVSRTKHARDLTWAWQSRFQGGPALPDVGKVQSYIQRSVGFKNRTGISGLAVVDELAGEALGWLSELCSCGHPWISHLRHQPPDGPQECTECECGGFDWFQAKVSAAGRAT